MNKQKYSQQQSIKRFLKSNTFVTIINIVRIITLIGVVVLIYIMVKEIEAVKLLAYDPCRICMEKSGCHCFCLST